MPTWHGGEVFRMPASFVQHKLYTPHPEPLQKSARSPPFNTRHDQVLKVIANFVKKQVPDGMHVVVDVEDQ